MGEHAGPDTGFKLFRLVKEVLAESGEADTDQLALEVLDRIPFYDRETALYQALRQLVRTSFRPAFIPQQSRPTTEPVATPAASTNRDGRQWLTREGAVVEDAADVVLAQGPEFVAGREAADEQIAAGDLGTPLADAMTEVEAEEKPRVVRWDDHKQAMQRRVPPPVAPRPKTSPKVAAIREAWRKSLMQRIAVGEGKHKFLGDCTVPDLEFAAAQREEHAKRTADRAGELRRLVALMREHDASKLSDLPAEVLADAPLDGAA